LSQLDNFDHQIYTIVFTYFSDGRRPRSLGGPWHFDVDISLAEQILAQKPGFRHIKMGGIILGRRCPDPPSSDEAENADLADDPIQLTSPPTSDAASVVANDSDEQFEDFAISRDPSVPAHLISTIGQLPSEPKVRSHAADPRSFKSNKSIARTASRLPFRETVNTNLSETQPLMSQHSVITSAAIALNGRGPQGDRHVNRERRTSHEGLPSTVVASSRQGTPAMFEKAFLDLLHDASQQDQTPEPCTEATASFGATSPASKSSMGRGARIRAIFEEASPRLV
jgi:hypothetical protein